MTSRKPYEYENEKRIPTQAANEAGGWWQDVKAWLLPEPPAPVSEVDGEPFVPFDLRALRAAATAAQPIAEPATPVRSPATLTELGLPEELARNLEVTLRVMGATRDGQVIGYRFRTPDGAQHRLRIDEAA